MTQQFWRVLNICTLSPNFSSVVKSLPNLWWSEWVVETVCFSKAWHTWWTHPTAFPALTTESGLTLAPCPLIAPFELYLSVHCANL